jgi:predicted  nucleic acid-binding Zn-ribbon protein
MKKLFAITLSLSLITLFAFQNNDNATNDTPSVFQARLSENPSDTADIDAEMKKLEVEMKVWENKMKPYEQEMKVWEAKMKPYQDDMKSWEAKMKPYEKQMKELERKLRNSPTTEAERKKITDEMSDVSKNMNKIGDGMGETGSKMGEVGNEMGKIGNKMSEIGTEMGKIGTKMGDIGTQMEKRHKKIFSWFFKELKKDGFLTADKCSILMEYDVFIVNGQSLGKEQYQKYKLGIENRLGKPLKADFSIYFKGTISNLTEEGFDFDGNMNSNY